MLLSIAKKTHLHFWEGFSMREFIILSLDFSCFCRNSTLSCGREIILSVFLQGLCA